jgi:hypothetical protein
MKGAMGLDCDGTWKSCMNIARKNYATMEHNGKIKLTGNSIKSKKLPLYIEDFLDKTRIAIKSNQKNVNLTIKEATDLQNSLAIVMTRLAGELEQILTSQSTQSTSADVKMDGGNF